MNKPLVLLVWVSACWCATGALAQPNGDEPNTAIAPPGFDILEHSPTGVIYADKQLLKRYHELTDSTQRLRQQILAGDLSAQDAEERLTYLRQQLTTLKQQIDETKVLVEPFRSFAKTFRYEFPLSDSQRIVITADNVRVKGWEGPGILCVMEKVILSEEPPADEEFDAIFVEHEIRIAQDWVGMTDQQRAADEAKFLASEDGRKLTDEAKKNRAKFVAEIHDSYAMYKDFQGREINALRIGGLSGQEGNRMITGKTNRTVPASAD